MMTMKKTQNNYYLTTTLPYVNASPHVGFALEIIQADVIARYRREQGDEVFFNTGTDEHGIKIFRKAQEEGVDVQSYVDSYAQKFDALKGKLGLSYTNFIRTTDPDHVAAAQEFWKRCEANGDIYKKNYSVKYCVGCELEKTDSELEKGICPLHPTQEIEHIEEENYFFKFSAYQDKLLELYKNNPEFVLPKSRLNEIRTFVEGGLQDFSISRQKEKMPWGVVVPGDEGHVMYVWFDALVNYISAIGWPNDMEMFSQWWPVIQVAGKDNLRQQSAMWQAMLLSAGMETSRQVLIHGFITSAGQKMSKSVGNVIDPIVIVEKYGTDALRYYLIREIPPFEDGDFTEEKFIEAYNANLANGLGNLVSRTTKMALTYFDGNIGSIVSETSLEEGITLDETLARISQEYTLSLEVYEFNRAADAVWELIGLLDGYIASQEPYKMIKVDEEETKRVLNTALRGVHHVASLLAPMLPGASQTILSQIKVTSSEVTCTPAEGHLFSRV